jgi:hypothetical protein
MVVERWKAIIRIDDNNTAGDYFATKKMAVEFINRVNAELGYGGMVLRINTEEAMLEKYGVYKKVAEVKAVA